MTKWEQSQKGTDDDRSHAPRGNAASDALRPTGDARLKSRAVVTRSVTGCVPTQSVGTIVLSYVDVPLCPLELAALLVGEHVAKVPDLMGLEALLVEAGLA